MLIQGRQIRVRPILTRLDPYMRAAKKLASPNLSSMISGKMALNPIHLMDFVYLGKPTNTVKPTFIKSSFYPEAKFDIFLGMILEAIAEMQAKTAEKQLEKMPSFHF
ncbi:unnamed protein product [Allacma fusca]|uniref:Uncharacterized protein n=1 Tax=Allacma fusca TaxID=39272 RepID=A0A8J2KVJ2_9HEXA|nr:unnamed protein product [Allacma fusca]